MFQTEESRPINKYKLTLLTDLVWKLLKTQSVW